MLAARDAAWELPAFPLAAVAIVAPGGRAAGPGRCCGCRSAVLPDQILRDPDLRDRAGPGRAGPASGAGARRHCAAGARAALGTTVQVA